MCSIWGWINKAAVKSPWTGSPYGAGVLLGSSACDSPRSGGSQGAAGLPLRQCGIRNIWCRDPDTQTVWCRSQCLVQRECDLSFCIDIHMHAGGAHSVCLTENPHSLPPCSIAHLASMLYSTLLCINRKHNPKRTNKVFLLIYVKLKWYFIFKWKKIFW